MPKNKSEKNVVKALSLAVIVKARGTIEQIEELCVQGTAINTEELSLQRLQAYIKPLVDKKLNHKLINTIEIFKHITNRKMLKKLIVKPFYRNVFNENGNLLEHELISMAYESECITLLKKNKHKHTNQGQQRLWHLAVRNNCKKVIEFLLLHRAQEIDCLDEKGLTPWCLAVILNNVDLAKMLQENGANTGVFLNEEGQTLLHIAVAEEDRQLLKQCLDCQVPSNIVDIHGYTAHYYAHLKKDKHYSAQLKRFQGLQLALLNDYFNSIRNGNVASLKNVLRSKFNRNVRNGQGYTALDIANISKHQEIIDLLEANGVERTLSQNEVSLILKNKSTKPQSVDSQFYIRYEDTKKGLVLSIDSVDDKGKRHNEFSIYPWSKNQQIAKNSRWKYLTKNDACYLVLMDEIQGIQPKLICLLKQTGDLHLNFANLPTSALIFNMQSHFIIDGLISIGQLDANAKLISFKKQSKMLNGSVLKLDAKNIELEGKLSVTEANIHAENTYQQSADLTIDKCKIQGNTITVSGQTFAAKQFEYEAHGRFILSGHIVTGHQGVTKGHVIQIERNSGIISQHGSLTIYGSSKINNLGAIVGNQVALTSSLMITNHMGALIKGLHCTLQAPQVNQAGFLLSGQKSTLSYVDLTLSGLHASVNVLEFVSIIPSLQAVTLRGCLLLGKTLYRGSELLRKATDGQDVNTIEIVSLIVDYIIPSIGFLSSADEKATLLINVLYQYYGAYSSDEQFIYKSLQVVEALTRTLSLISGGYLSEENMQWLQIATKIINGSRHALKLAEVGASALRAWHNDDQNELERAQEDLKTITEIAFREALYKLEPSQLLSSSLGVNPVDIVQYIINQGYSSEFYLQSIVYGTLHAAKRSGLIEVELENDLLLGTKLLFRMKHWHELFEQYQQDKLTAQMTVNEVFSSLMVILSSERVRSSIDALKSTTDELEVIEDVASSISQQESESELELEVSTLQELDKSIADIPKILTNDDIQNQKNDDINNTAKPIPEFPKQSVLLDPEAVAEKAMAAHSTHQNESRSAILLKSLVEVQKGFNGEYASHGYLGAFVTALHNEGIIEVTGNIGLHIQSGTNNGLIKATHAISLHGQEANNREQDEKVRGIALTETINSHFTNFEAGIIDAGTAIYLTCVGIVDNLGDVKSLGRIVATANRIIRNHSTGKIIAQKDVKLLCDLLAKNEGLIIGESVHFEGTLKKSVNKGTIIGVEKIRLLSSKLVKNAKKVVAKQVDLQAPKVIKDGAVQAELVKTTGYDTEAPEIVAWHSNEEDDIGVAILKASDSYDLDKDAFTKVRLLDVTLPATTFDPTQPLFDISSDFSNILQLHLQNDNQLIPIWQLPKMSNSAIFILDAPAAKLYSDGTQTTYNSGFRFSGDRLDYSGVQITFSQPALFDVHEITGLSANSELLLREGGLLQSDVMRNKGHVQSDGILDWNVTLLQNDTELAYTTEYFTYSKHNPILQPCLKSTVIPNSGTIEALGHRGFIGTFLQKGGELTSGQEGTEIYFNRSIQEAVLLQHGENPTGILHDAGQNWYVQSEWYNAKVTSSGECILIGSEDLIHSGFTFWGEQGTYLQGPKGIINRVNYQPYEIDQILSLTRSGRVNGVAHERERGYIATQSNISSNSGSITLIAPEGSIHLNNTVVSSAGNTILMAKDQISINGIALDKQSSHSYKNKKLLKKTTVNSITDEKIVYSSFIFTGGELVIRCDEFILDAVQGVIGSADIVALKTTLKGQQQTYHNSTTVKEFSIGVPGQDLLSIIKGHNAKAVFASVMNSSGWDQSQLNALLNAKSVTEIPAPLLQTARNAWNVAALVAHSCAELGESPADFVGAFTDRIGLTILGSDKIRKFNPNFTINSSKKIQETDLSKIISTNLLIGGTFRLYGNELHLLDGADVDAEDLRIFLIEGIKATKAENTYQSTSKNTHHHLGISALKPQDLSVSSTKIQEVDVHTESKLASLSARNTAQINGGEMIEGDLKISAQNGGEIIAKKMHFVTSQNTRVLRSHTRRGNVSTHGSVGGAYQAKTINDRTTQEKAGIILPGGVVSANEINLKNGSKIQTGTLSREDAEAGLPSVIGTDGHDHQEESQKGFNFSISTTSEPSADVSRSVNESETLHRPTVIADNISADDLLGINVDAQRESEVVSEKNSGFAVAGFIPNKEKIRNDLDAMKKTQQKGLLWLFNKQGTQSKTIASDSIEPIVPAATNLTSPVEKASSDESLSITTSNSLLEPEPLYQFGTGEYSSHLLDSISDLDFLELSTSLNQDRLVPLYDVSSSRLVFPFYYYNPSGVLDLDLTPQLTNGSTLSDMASSETASSTSDASSLTGRLLYDYDPITARLNIYIYKPPSWVLPDSISSDTSSPNNASSIGDVSRYDAFIEHVDAFNRGFETARDGLLDAAIHPIRTAVEISTLIGDGLNAITNVTFGIATEGARQRNSQRVALYHELKESFINGDSVYRTEMLTELGTSLILGSVSGAAVGRVCSGLSRQSMIAMNQYIVTPQGLAVQQLTIPALYHRARLTYGKEKQIYRIGDSSKGSRGAEGQYWSVKAPDKHHAYRYGVPAKNVQDISNLDIRLAGEIVPNKRFITRHAPGVKDNPGGAIEVVVDSGNVKVTSKTVPIVEQQTPTLLYRGGRQLKNTLISDNTLGVLAVSNHTQESRERFKLL